MAMTASEKIKIILKRVGMTAGELADATGQTRQNLSNKMARDDLKEAEIKRLAEALGCAAEVVFTLPDGSTL